MSSSPRGSARPLLADDQLSQSSYSYSHSGSRSRGLRGAFATSRASAQRLLASRRKHYLVLAIVALDVACLLANIFVELIACDAGEEDAEWVVRTNRGLTAAGLAFSCAFLVELAMCVLAFGLGYFSSWFHRFDALVIVASFGVDVAVHGIAEEIASLVVMLRLWRLVKIVEEVSVGAAERMEEAEQELEKLREENRVMSIQLARRGSESDDDEEGERRDVERGRAWRG